MEFVSVIVKLGEPVSLHLTLCVRFLESSICFAAFSNALIENNSGRFCIIITMSLNHNYTIYPLFIVREDYFLFNFW